MEKYREYLDDRSMPRLFPAKVFATLGKHDQVHFDNTDATMAATSQMICDALR